jgi:predicted TIM-barrel fold metal-dependent hydrolase
VTVDTGADLPTSHRLRSSLQKVLDRHLERIFVAAHGLHAKNLVYVLGLLERFANIHIDIASVHMQLGRQPRAARDLISRFSDWVLFGTDVLPLREKLLKMYSRLLLGPTSPSARTDDPM